VYRPADGNETSGVYACALLRPHAPAVVALSRQNLPQLAGSSVEACLKGGYRVWDSTDASGGTSGAAPGNPDVIIAATGSEVCIAIDGAKAFTAATGKRSAVVSFPCLDIFDEQPLEYRLADECEHISFVAYCLLCPAVKRCYLTACPWYQWKPFAFAAGSDTPTATSVSPALVYLRRVL
jgi:transketolase